MNKVSKHPYRVLFAPVVKALLISCFFSCQKADPSPYGDPAAGASKFYLYGNGTYGSFNSYTFDAKLLIKLSGE